MAIRLAKVRRIRFEAQKRCTPTYLHGKEERTNFGP
jgi:hypothetical protein